MEPCEQAVRRYIDAWFEPDRGRRAELLAACFADDARIAIADRVIRGRGELAAAIDAFQADPRRLAARLTSPIDADGTTFRFRALFTLPDGRRHSELIDFGEIDGDGRIANLFTFEEPLVDGDAGPGAEIDAGSAAAQAAQRYVEVFGARDPAARRARIEACFAPAARLVARRRSYRGVAEIAAMVEAALGDPRGFTAGRTTAIATAGAAFRFGTIGSFGDGSPPFLGEDAGEIGGDGRITVIYLFAGRLAPSATP